MVSEAVLVIMSELVIPQVRNKFDAGEIAIDNFRFLGTDYTLALFQLFGNIPVWRDRLVVLPN